MIGRETKDDNNLFYVCSLIEYIARKTKNTTTYIVDKIGYDKISKVYNLADVYHSENIDKISDEFIELCNINNGNYDCISNVKYSIPSHFDIGKVYKRLVLGISKYENISIVDALFKAYHSFVTDKIHDFNSSFYYDNPGSILNAYIYNVIE